MKNSHLYIGDYTGGICDRIKNSKVLDIGCLATYQKNELKKHKRYMKATSKIIGIDVKETIYDWINDGWSNLRYCDILDNKQANKLLKECGKFDHIVATDIIEHIDNHRDFLRNCYKLLRPKGLIHISTPNMRSLFYINHFDINKDHVCWFDIVTIGVLLNRHGFEIKEHFYGDKKKVDKLTSENTSKKLGLQMRAEFCKKLYVVGAKSNHE